MRRRRGGYSLIELVLSLSVTSLLVAGISAAMVVASRSQEHASGPVRSLRQAGLATRQLADELGTALSITQPGTKAITFSTPDRNGDGSPETVRYEWSGVDGDPLTRTGLSPVLAEGRRLEVGREFALVYDLVNMAEAAVPAEAPLAGKMSTTNLAATAIGNTEWISQSFVPALPADAIGWRIRRVVLWLRRYNTSNGQMTLQVRLANLAGRPTSVVLDSMSCPESDLAIAYTTQSFSLPGTRQINPDDKVCIVVAGSVDYSAQPIYENGLDLLFAGRLCSTTNAGSSWTIQLGKVLCFEIHGEVLTESGSTGVPVVRAVRMRLRAGNDLDTVIESGIPTLNRPVLGGS